MIEYIIHISTALKILIMIQKIKKKIYTKVTKLTIRNKYMKINLNLKKKRKITEIEVQQNRIIIHL